MTEVAPIVQPTERGAPASVRPVREFLVALPRRVVVALLRAYQLVISPMYGPTCKYYPSCSSYALLAVQRHGVLRGGWLAVRRLARCHPWAAGGIDDVPEAPTRTSKARTHA